MKGGISQRGRIEGGDDIVGYIGGLLLHVERVVSEAVEDEQEQILARMQAKARQEPRWANVADHMNQWTDENDDINVGVSSDSDAYDEAMRAEYGDENNPPVPLLRMGTRQDMHEMGMSLEQRFRERGL